MVGADRGAGPVLLSPCGQGARAPPDRPGADAADVFLQQWYTLADEALEDAIYDSQALRNFVGIDLGTESVPDATTLLQFRHLLEKHDLTKTIFETVNRHLRERGLLLNKGTLTDATILAAPSSTKNQEKARDPEMHQTRKGNQWYFGMKAHIGADGDSGLVHTVVGTAANIADVSQTEHLLHGEEEVVFADAGYIGAEKREALKDKPVKWRIATVVVKEDVAQIRPPFL